MKSRLTTILQTDVHTIQNQRMDVWIEPQSWYDKVRTAQLRTVQGEDATASAYWV